MLRRANPMLARHAILSSAVWALMVAAPCGCSSQTAIVISVLGDAAPAAEVGASTGTSTSTSTSTSTATVLFSDNFGGGYEVNWLLSVSNDGPVSDTQDGSNKIVTLDSTQNDYTRLRCNLDGSKFTNTSITASMKVRIEQAPSSTRTVRLDVRQAAATENIFYAVGASIATDGSMTKVSIFKKVDDGAGGYTICSLAEGKFATAVAMGQWRTIKLTISGTTSVRLAAFFEDAQMASFVDDCVSSLTSTAGVTVANGGCLADQTGIGIQVEKGVTASVDDVLVVSP
jgi:hypothetical protein